MAEFDKKKNIEKNKKLGKREIKRENLRNRLLEAACSRIQREGIYGLRARDITADAGCALGGLYTAFDSLEDLIIHVNSRTLAMLGQALSTALIETDAPAKQLHNMAFAYLSFANEHTNLWRALFDQNLLPQGSPDWHESEQGELLSLIGRPLSRLYPNLEESALSIRSRTIFSAVHGIVMVSIEQRYIAVTGQALVDELTHFLDLVVDAGRASRD
jgi:AcrR family transcriptional regulator